MVKTEIEKEEFVKQNLGLVHSCANRMRGKGIEYDDLFSAGCLGLIKAIDGFDPDRGIMFSTYAVPVILGEIKRLFRDGGYIKVSRSIKETAMKALRAKDEFVKVNGREPLISELADKLSISNEQVTEALLAQKPPVSLTMSEDEKDSQFDIAIDSDDEKICEKISIDELIKSFDKKDRELIVLRYFKNKTQTQTAKLLDMTQVQVSRREKKLLQSLKVKLSE